MNIAEIEALVNEVATLIRRSPSKKQPSAYYQNDGKELPNFNPIYKQTVELRDRIRVHTDLNHRPHDMIRRRGPYEDDKQYKYRTENWNNITMPYFMKAMGMLNRIMNPSNYSITWDAGQAEEKEYIEEYIPVFGSIEKYFEQIVLSDKITDPNALLVIKPYSLPIKEVIVDDQQVFVYDDSKKIDSAAFIYPCEKVIHFKQGVYAMIEIEEKSVVYFDGKPVKEGKVFEIYDTENIYRVYQVGKKIDYKFSQPEVYYYHGLGYLPCEKLRGIPKLEENYTLYQSYFIYAVPHLDVALYGYSNLDMSIITQLFPQRVEYVDRCDYQGCDNGYIRMERDGNIVAERCPSCHGTGGRGAVGPMMVKQHIAPDPLNTSPDTQIPFPGLTYVAPPSEQLEFVYKKNQEDILAAFSFLNIDVSNSEPKGSDVALSKQIDREELFSFLMRISNELFWLLDFAIETITLMRFGTGAKKPVISPPTSFAIRSEYDLTEELIEGKKAGLPDIALRQIIRDYVAKRFSNQANIEKVVSLVFLTDRLLTSNQVDISAKLSIGICQKWEAVLHDSIYTIIDNALIEDPKFFDKPIETQKDYIITESKRIADEIASSNKAIVKIEDIAE